MINTGPRFCHVNGLAHMVPLESNLAQNVVVEFGLHQPPQNVGP